MNFFEAQKRARHSTFKLLILFLFGVIGIIVSSYYVIVIALNMNSENNLTLPPVTLFEREIDAFWVIALGMSLFIGLGTLYKVIQLSKGGAYIAASLGGKLIPNSTQKTDERKLLNIVEEMSIASGIPVPPVYLLDEMGINAFAAGNSYDDAVIGITKGAISILTRDELQGVIAHEFSHIFNGDMRLNLRIMGILHGILLIGLIGRSLLRSIQHTPSRHTKKGKDGKSSMFILGIGFVGIGYVGYIVGEWIKAMISRQREYLADASAVQYTRNPNGISGALKKIGSAHEGSQLKAPHAQAFSHAFFSDAVKNFWDTLFATHPPLKERILRIEPAWDGNYTTLKENPVSSAKTTESIKQTRQDKTATLATVLATLHTIGEPQQKHLSYARQQIALLPHALVDHLHEPLGAQAVILALLHRQEDAFKKEQINFLRANDTLIYDTFIIIAPLINAVTRESYLTLINLSRPVLKTLSKSTYKKFRILCEHFILIDKQRSLFEWVLEQLIVQSLDIHFNLKKRPKETHHSFRSIKTPSDILLSFIAQSDQSDAQAMKVFEILKQTKSPIKPSFIQRSMISWESLATAIFQIQKSSAPLRNELLKAAIISIRQDGEVSTEETELIHALAALLYLPLPPLVDIKNEKAL